MKLCINHDFCTAPIHVRYWMNSGKQMLALSFSGFDHPQRTSGKDRPGILGEGFMSGRCESMSTQPAGN
jgi:hypothetical protein